MSQVLSDDEALLKANSMQWFDNQAGMVERFNPQNRTGSIKHKPKLQFVKKPHTDDQFYKRGNERLETLNFEECSIRFGEAVERISTYQSLPSEVKELMKDSIVGTAKYMTALKIRMKQIANPEQMNLLAYVERMKNKSVNAKALRDENNALRSQLNSNENQSVKTQRQQRTELRLLNAQTAKDLNLAVFSQLKQLIKDEYGEVAFLALIQQARMQADRQLGLTGQGQAK